MPTNGTIVDRLTVELNTAERKAVARLYSNEIIDDTIVEQITYYSDNLKIKGHIARPREDGQYPVLIWNRGGTGDRGAITDLTAHLILASTAQWGYVVLGTQYRGNMGSEGADEWGGRDIRDAHHLLDVAERMPQCDMSRIAVEGASRGGITTYRLLAMDDRFRCAIVHAGVVDLFDLCDKKGRFALFCDNLLSGMTLDEQREETRKRSAAYFVQELPKSTPILLLHGDSDTVISISQSEAMAAALRQQGIPHQLEIIPGGTHVALKDGSYRVIDEFRKDWLEKHLKSV